MSDIELRQQIADIASRFPLFKCIQCATAIKNFLILKGIHGKHIQLYTGSAENPYGNIFHEILQENIAINGVHEGIAVAIAGEELIFDNINHQGIPRQAWLENLHCFAQDLGEDFQITEINF